MARQLEFNRMDALALAVDAFWRDGYEALPALELAEAMGVAKSSLYNTFGSKKLLFLEVLDHYGQVQRARMARLSKSPDMKSAMREFLTDVARDNSDGRGCLLVNACAELGLRDREVRERVKAGLDGLVQAFAALIRSGQAAGTVAPNLVAEEHAVVVIAGISGLRILAKSGFSEHQLRPVIESLLIDLFV